MISGKDAMYLFKVGQGARPRIRAGDTNDIKPGEKSNRSFKTTFEIIGQRGPQSLQVVEKRRRRSALEEWPNQGFYGEAESQGSAIWFIHPLFAGTEAHGVRVSSGAKGQKTKFCGARVPARKEKILLFKEGENVIPSGDRSST